jgi:hypothetical protein
MSTIPGPQLQHHRLFCSLILAAKGHFQRKLTERYTFACHSSLSETAGAFRAINVKTGLSPQARPRRAFHYAWIVAAVTFVTLLITAAIRATISILLVPFENEFHWTPASISTVISVNLVLFGLIGPFAAGLIQRFGPRKIMIVSLGLLGIGVGLTALVFGWIFAAHQLGAAAAASFAGMLRTLEGTYD